MYLALAIIIALLLLLLNKTLNIIKSYNQDIKENIEDLQDIKEEIGTISDIMSRTFGTYYEDIHVEKTKEKETKK